MGRSEYKAVRARARHRQQRVAAFVALVLIAIFSLGILTSCGPRGVALDPRDEEAVEEFENICNRRSSTVELKIHNRGSAAYDVWLVRRAGGKRRIGTIGGFERKLKLVARMELELGGTFVVRQSTGLTIGSGEYLVNVGLLSCDVGYLELGPTLNMSHYIGMDFYPNDVFKR